MVLLHLVRHGETHWNHEGRVQGSSDVPLNDLGRQQARDAALRFADLAGRPAAVVTSDLQRASETAEILATMLGLPAPRRYPSLRERAYGVSEGMLAREIVATYGDWRTSQIPGAEPWGDLRVRSVRAVHEVASDLLTMPAPPESVLVVSHGALIRELVRHLTDDRLPTPDSRLGNLEGVRLLVEGERMTLLDES